MNRDWLRVIWNGMKSRCYKETNNRYYCYGARGIRVCDEWLNYDNFKKWMLANGWQKGLQIDRINNDGNYQPSNCRIVTRKENQSHRSDSRIISFNGELNTVAKISEAVGISHHRIRQRIDRDGWSEQDAVSKPLRINGTPIKCLNNGKVYKSQAEAARELNVFQNNITHVCNKKRKHTGGYSFEFV